MYVKSGWTHKPKFDGNVHGVVVQASSDVVGSSTSGNDTVTICCQAE